MRGRKCYKLVIVTKPLYYTGVDEKKNNNLLRYRWQLLYGNNNNNNI